MPYEVEFEPSALNRLRALPCEPETKVRFIESVVEWAQGWAPGKNSGHDIDLRTGDYIRSFDLEGYRFTAHFAYGPLSDGDTICILEVDLTRLN